MSNSWPDSLLDEIRGRNDIVEVISDYVLLTKKGKNYLGLCPFHHEKTPSFTVTPDKQMFYCFGCQTGGNVFTFLAKKENITAFEAINMLADRVGIKLPQADSSPQEMARIKQQELIATLNKAACDLYHDNLLKDQGAQTARDYLAGRGIDRQTIDRYKLGFAADGWSFLTDALLKRGFTHQDLITAGLATQNDRGGAYDRFRNRLMFPIINIRSQVIGFGGRVLDDSLPKYLNTSETSFFIKGHNLFGMDSAHKVIREKNEVLVVEGYMDVIAAQRHGFGNTVATLGTALTRDQGKLIQRYTHNVILGYDSDSAGISATFKGAEILRDLGCNVKVLTLSEDKDPDEFLRHKPAEEFAKLLQKSPGFVEYKLDKLVKEKPPTSVSAKVEIIKNLAPDILKSESLVEQEGYVRLAGNALGLSQEVIFAEIKRISAKTRKSGYYSDNNHSNSHTINELAQTESGSNGNQSLPVADRDNANLRTFRAENMLLGLMLDNPEVVTLVDQNAAWDIFKDPLHREICAHINENWHKGQWSPSSLFELIEDETVRTTVARMTLSDSGVTNPIRQAEDCIKAIEDENFKYKIENLQEQTRLMQKSGDIETQMKLLQEINSLLQQKSPELKHR